MGFSPTVIPMVMSLQPNISPGIAISTEIQPNGAFRRHKIEFHRKSRGWGNFDKAPLPATSMPKRPDHIFLVDSDSCFGCAACVALCPVDALSLQALLAVVDQSRCTHCDLCIPACPVHALSIVQEVDSNALNSIPELIAH